MSLQYNNSDTTTAKRSVLSDISGVVAIRHIAQATSTLVKVGWIVILVLSASLCSIMIFQLLSDYIQNPIISIQDLQITNMLEFPTITLCFYLRANGSLVKKYNYSTAQMTYLFAAFDGSYDNYPQYSENDVEKFQQSLPNETKNIEWFFHDKVGIYCEDVLKKCSFQGFQFNCCNEARIFLSDTGKCVTLHLPRRHQTIPGNRGGLKITFEMYEDSYPKAFYYNYPNEGLALHITDPSTSNNLSSNPVLISSKRYVMIQLTKRTTKLHASGNCVDVESTVARNRLRYFKDYSQNACINECIVNATLRICNCALIGSIQSAKAIPMCKPLTAVRCAHPARASILKYLTVGNCSCRLQCTYTDYSSQFGMMKVPSTGYFDTMCSELKIDPDWADKRMDTAATIEIYFGDFMFWTTRLQPRFSIPEFISLLGSQLSLWVGVRIVTLFEIIYVSAKIVYRKPQITPKIK